MNFAKPMFFTGMVLAAGLAHSQSAATLGNLLDQGAKKLSSEEVKALLSGVTFSVPNGSGENKFTFSADGSLSALWNNGNNRSGGFGNWKVEDNGKYCYSVTWSATYIKPVSFCPYIFKSGEKYFFALSDTDRNAVADERTLSK